MDNLTHALTGMMVAEGVCAARPVERPAFRTAAFAASAVANNIPDIDPIYTWITGPRPLGSLLHHRGHTHTLPIAWALGLLVALCTIAWVQRRSGPLSQVERGTIVGLGLLGATLHIVMDYGNNYGVHPLWPLDSHWYYGDSIFIIEPLWLAIALPLMACTVATRWLAGTLWLLLVGLFVLALRVPFVTAGTVLGMAALSGAMLWISLKSSRRTRIALAFIGYLAVTLCFVLGGTASRAAIRTALARDHATLQVVDVASTPMPGNPLCWSALVVGRRDGLYWVLGASVASLSSVTSAEACPYDAGARPTARLTWLPATRQRLDVQWRWVYSADLSALRALARDDCRFRALLGFARVPYVSEVELPGHPGATQRVAGDLRYDRGPGLDFADMPLDDQATCPKWLPPWVPPRRDLLLSE